MPTVDGEHVAGDFSLEVIDGAGDLVGGSASPFTVSSCPVDYFFKQSTGKCTSCPAGADCAGGKQLPVPQPGFWSELVGYADLGEVFEARTRAFRPVSWNARAAHACARRESVHTQGELQRRRHVQPKLLGRPGGSRCLRH